MIVSLIASIITWQLNYTYRNKIYKSDLPDLVYQITLACGITSYMTFNLAHWFFAFSYLALSYRIELTAKNLSLDTYNCRLSTVNIFVCLFNVVVPAIIWIYSAKGEYKAANIANGIY